jgi:hypothetical protein
MQNRYLIGLPMLIVQPPDTPADFRAIEEFLVELQQDFDLPPPPIFVPLF